MERCDETGVIHPEAEFQAGDAVTLTAGPFANFVAEIQSIETDRRIWVLMDIMGRQTRTTVSEGQIRRV